MPKQILKRRAACLRSGGRMLSRIRFSCSLAAADGPWEETTDEAEKTSLRTLSRFGKERAWTSWKPSPWTFSRMARIFFLTSRHSEHPCRWGGLQGCSWSGAGVFKFSIKPSFPSGILVSAFPPENQFSKKEKTGFSSENRLFSPATAPARIKTFKNTKYLQILGGNTRHTSYVLCVSNLINLCYINALVKVWLNEGRSVQKLAGLLG